MARGIDPLNDPRWEGQDSQSLPDRPAHPDPSRRAEFGDPEKTPSHGIFGHLEAKHGLVSDKDLDADRADLGPVAKSVLDGEQVASIEASAPTRRRPARRTSVTSRTTRPRRRPSSHAASFAGYARASAGPQLTAENRAAEVAELVPGDDGLRASR
jgi:hypothetical protein